MTKQEVIDELIMMAKQELKEGCETNADNLYWLQQLESSLSEQPINIQHIRFVLMGVESSKILNTLKKMNDQKQKIYNILSTVIDFTKYYISK